MSKVSVIVPVYNGEKYLTDCLNSIINQSLKDIEIIIVDDGSSDSSLSIINSFAESDNRITVLTQQNLFAGIARNNGFEKATGEYVAFFDCDDLFDENMLYEMYNKAKAVDADICVCSAVKFNNENGENIDYSYSLKANDLPESDVFSSNDISDKIFNFTSPCPWNKLFKTSFIKSANIKFQKTQRTNDLFFTYLSLASAKKITCVNKPFVKYRTQNKNSLQGSSSSLSLDFYTALYGLKKELQNRKIYTKFEKSFVNRALSTTLYVFNSVADKKEFFELCDLLKNKYVYDLGIIGHSRGYFYVKKDFDVFFDIISMSAEDLYQKYKNPVKTDVIPFVDIDNWQCPVQYESTGTVKISVIIPAYNVEKYIEECVYSVLNNSFKDIEVIVVNDGSSDSTLQILEKIKQQDNRLSVVSKSNDGQSAARNDGIALAKGKYILFVDSDDYIHQKSLEYLYYNAEKDNLDQLYFTAVSFYDGVNANDYSFFDNLYKRKHDYSNVVTGREFFTICANNGEFRPSPVMAISKRELFVDNNISFEKNLLHEDNLFIIQCLSFAKKVKYENAALYYRRVRKDSIMTGASKIKRTYSYYKIIKLVEDFALEQHFMNDKPFYDALMHQLSVMNISACEVVKNLDEQELIDFIHTLDEKSGIDFYNHINAVLRIRNKSEAYAKSSKNNHEIAVMNELIKNHNKAILENENKQLKQTVSSANEEINKYKSLLSKKLVVFALKLDAFIKKLKRK